MGTHRDTREVILLAAQRLFAAQGFAGTSLTEIAGAAGVTKSLVHYHFGSKQKLWASVSTRVTESLHHEPETDADLGAEDEDRRLWGHAERYFRFLQTNPDVVGMLSRSGLNEAVEDRNLPSRETDEELSEHALARQFAVPLREALTLLEAYQRAGRIRQDVRPAVMLAMLISLIQAWFTMGANLRHELGADDALSNADDHYLQAVLRILRRGMEVPAAGKKQAEATRVQESRLCQ